MNDEQHSVRQVATLGCGVIGASWTALFLAGGYRVDAYDPMPDAQKRLIQAVQSIWPTMQALGYDQKLDLDRLVFHQSATEAVSNADFIQESVPEQLPLKHALFKSIEPHLKKNAIVSSSASGLMLGEMQGGWISPSRFILGHPFNPPHLIPLVELLANDRTDSDVLPVAEAFYQGLGKVTIRVKREVPAHVANRLQAALWREAISLVVEGVASVDDVDKAVWAGPGLRWAAMGPHQLFHLGAGVGGLEEFCQRYGDSFHRWWDDLGDAKLTPEVIEQLFSGVTEKSGDISSEQGKQLAHQKESNLRDQLIVSMLKSSLAVRQSNKTRS